ncbi:MAG TPA: hypothetical protein PK079_01655 [Leptospiraceae bacterium]|nr:hypothetical protein [Leptospiraceae bacterium]HMW04780.1 hypothetical protein [Leptospiraceae bacterium]HMX32797.1 hypothetical protein [Leptospiraceae bacterium]HMY33552.1 hypothetical protein [Leptospiraceae bacterium]HMZ65533.1 hypothetical protein [Leptospiraceae bacterium]
MKIRNNLFLILFHSKEEDRWESWKRFAEKNNYTYSLLSDPVIRPILRGTLYDKPICIEAAYTNILETDLSIRIQSPIHNPQELYFLVEDKKAYKSKKGIFDKTISGFCKNRELEEKFFIKSNSETFPIKMLNRNNLTNDLMGQDNFAIEVANYELTLTTYNILSIDKEFIGFLKLFYSFLSAFEETTIESFLYRKQ